MNQRIRLASPTAVAQMATVNHAKLTLGHAVAAVTLSGVVYFWAA